MERRRYGDNENIGGGGFSIRLEIARIDGRFNKGVQFRFDNVDFAAIDDVYGALVQIDAMNGIAFISQ